MSKESIEVSGIMLRKECKYGEDDPMAYVVVEVEIGGKWVEVIRELASSNFSHIVNPGGIIGAARAAGPEGRGR